MQAIISPTIHHLTHKPLTNPNPNPKAMQALISSSLNGSLPVLRRTRSPAGVRAVREWWQLLSTDSKVKGQGGEVGGGDERHLLEFRKILSGEPLIPRNDRPCLVVNTASLCGLTPQLGELELVYKRFGEDLTILAVPSNDFGKQEPWEEDKIQKFYNEKYGVGFHIAGKVIIL